MALHITYFYAHVRSHIRIEKNDGMGTFLQTFFEAIHTHRCCIYCNIRGTWRVAISFLTSKKQKKRLLAIILGCIGCIRLRGRETFGPSQQSTIKFICYHRFCADMHTLHVPLSSGHNQHHDAFFERPYYIGGHVISSD